MSSQPTAIASRTTSAGGYRYELHGLRATAIAMVAAYHVWFDRVSGGIDVFLLISSFLLMQTFLRRIERKKLDLRGYWGKAFRRLLAPAVVVVLVTAALVLVFYPATRYHGVIEEGIASLLYSENWYLAINGADYFADHSAISPLQHFWSLSVQGQVFLLWPALIGACFMLGAKRVAKTKVLLWLAFSAIFVASFTWSVYQTAHNQQFAYFSTFTRLWEFALGALLALLVPHIEKRFGYGPGIEAGPGRLNVIVRAILGWIGLIGVLSCGFVIDVQGAFPGYVALWPTLCASLVIVCGHTGLSWGADRLLSIKPLQKLGDWSYSLYLVHWPLLITSLQITGHEHAGWLEGALVLGASLVFAHALTKQVDQPIRRSVWAGAKKLRSLAIILISLVIGITPLAASEGILNYQSWRAEQLAVRNNPGARVLYEDDLLASDADVPPLPLYSEVREDWWSGTYRCEDYPAYIAQPSELDPKTCSVSNPEGSHIALIVGNSRMEQITPMIVDTLIAQDYAVVTILSGGVPFGPTDNSQTYDDLETRAETEDLGGGSLYNNREYYGTNRYLINYIENDLKPDLVVMETTDMLPLGHGLDGADERLIPGIDDAIKEFSDAGIAVIGIRGAPRFQESPTDCYESGGYCDVEVSELFASEDPTKQIVDEVSAENLLAIDATSLICPDQVCTPVVGNVYVFLDNFHLTATYAESMAGYYEAKVSEFADAVANR